MKNRWLIFATIYVLVNHPNGSISRYSYEGQSLDAVTYFHDNLVKTVPGTSYMVVDEATALSAPIPDPAPIKMVVDPIEQQEIADANNQLLDPQTRISAMLKVMGISTK